MRPPLTLRAGVALLTATLVLPASFVQSPAWASPARAGAAMRAHAVPVDRDVPYGRHPLQRFDVYGTARESGLPVIVLVHGGGWSRGDKASRTLVAAKVARWVPRGFVVISINYRLQPDATPREQAADVARAMATVQAQAPRWGADPDRIILMGHSAGAHLVSLLSADPGIARQQGARRWLGTVALDSAAFDVVRIMSAPHARLYDAAFGADPSSWAAASPVHVHRAGAAPMLAVCSMSRPAACAQADAYAATAKRAGDRVVVLPWPLGHRAVNEELGKPGRYTERIEAFMGTLDPKVARLLAGTGGRRPLQPSNRSSAPR